MASDTSPPRRRREPRAVRPPDHRHRGLVRPGAAVADRLVTAGAKVTVLDRRPSPSGVPTVEVDLADGRATEEAVAAVAKEAGGLGRS